MADKYLSDAARTLASVIVSKDRLYIVRYQDRLIATDSYVAVRLDAIRAQALISNGLPEGHLKLSIGKGLVPVGPEGYSASPHKGLAQIIESMVARSDERVTVLPTNWRYQEAGLLDGPKGPTWINAGVLDGWMKLDAALGLDLVFRHESGTLKPVEVLGRLGPKATYWNPRHEDSRPRETIAYIMPVNVEAKMPTCWAKEED